MKKNPIIRNLIPLPLFYALNLTVILLLAPVLSQASAKDSTSVRFNIRKTNITLQEFFDEIEKNSDYSFFYKNKEIDIREKVSVDATDASIDALLEQAFEGKNISYAIRNTSIVLSRKSAPAKTKTSQPARIAITGTVRDTEGERLAGVTIMVKGTTNGTVTDAHGEYRIHVADEKAELLFSFLGFEQQTVIVDRRTEINVTMRQDAHQVDDIVVVGYGTQKKASVVGSMASINVDKLRVPSSNLSAAFAGQLAGVIAVQRSGEPGADGADFWIRGISTFSGMTSPLIVIDGVKASSGDLNALDPEMIESFSILKDATATALYGSRGANGVMIVTTKSGRDLDKPIINVRVEGSYTMPSKVPKFADGPRFMEMYNEALYARTAEGAGTPVGLYSREKIDATRLGLDPYIFPNVDWYDEMFRKGSTSQNVNVSIRGGGRKMDYFSSASFHNDDGMLKNSDVFSYKNNLSVQRYVLQNNINVYITPTTRLTAKVNAQLRDYHGSHMTAQSVFGMVMDANPVDFPIMFPDDSEYDYVRWGGKTGGNYGSHRNPYAEMVRGYQDNFSSTVLGNIELKQDFGFLTEGLTASAMFSFKNWSSTTTTRSGGYNQFQVTDYTWNPERTAITDYNLAMSKIEQDPTLAFASDSGGDRQIYIQAMINYDRTFGEKHNVTGMLVYNQEEYSVNKPADFISSLPQRKQGIAGRLTYAYDYKYLFEANFGYNGSENFAKGHRFGFFPSIGVGYVVSREKFFEPISHVVSNLKLRASWGLVGNDQVGAGQRFVYLSNVVLQDTNLGYVTGREQNYDRWGPNYKRFANPNIQWEVGEKWNAGLDLGLFKGSLNISADFFKEKRRNIFLERQNVPDVLGFSPTSQWLNMKTVVYGNLGVVDNRGFDLSVDYFKAFSKDFTISFKGTFTFAKNKVLDFDEPEYQKYPNLSIVGHPIGAHLVYEADRLFIDQAEIDASPSQTALGGLQVRPGDIKYKDIPDVDGNVDGMINASDRVYSKYSDTPQIVYGFGPTIKYKKWDFSFFFQGAARVQLRMYGIHPFGTDISRNVLEYIADDYWSEGATPNIYARYPRLSKEANPNNTATSTYWLRNGAFLKLKNVELGFNHKMMRIYLRATNLFAISDFKYWDPEQGSGNGLGYPTQRVVSLGLQFSFNK